MFCSQCGSSVSGRYCSKCGERIASRVPPSLSHGDWEHVLDYEGLTRIPEVRNRIAEAARDAPQRLSGEQFLGAVDAALTLGGAKPFLLPVAKVVHPIYSKLGAKTSRSISSTFPCAPASVFIEVLCSLARMGLPVRSIYQDADICSIEALLPSDIWSFEGGLMIELQRDDGGSRLLAVSHIRGQLFDWGKSRRILGKLISDIERSCD